MSNCNVFVTAMHFNINPVTYICGTPQWASARADLCSVRNFLPDCCINLN